MTSLIVDFPDDITLRICTNWISLKDLCRLDSAICVKGKRTHFLSVVGANYASIANSPPASPNSRDAAAHNINSKSLKWLTSRQLSIEHLHLSKDVDGLVVEECIPRSPKLLKNVKTLAITAGPKIAKSTILSVAKDCADLRSFAMNGFKNLPDMQVSAVVLRSPNLLTLNLSGCWTLRNEDVVRIFETCKKLETVDFSACFALTDETLVALGKHCAALKTLSVHHCAELTDDGVTALATGCRALQSLNLSSCVELTDDGVNALALHCAQLQTLDLSYLKNISDVSVGHVLARCPRLRELQLEGCAALTDAVIEKMGKFCPNLTSLNVRYCSKMTAQAIGEFKRAHDKTAVLSTACY